MKLRRTLLGMLLGSAMLALPFVAGAQTVKWKLGSQQGPKDVATTKMVELAKSVLEASNGRFNIEVVTIDTLGYKQADALRMLKQKAIDAVVISPYYMGRDEPLLSNLLPFNAIVEESDNWKVAKIQSEIAREIYEKKWDMVLAAPFFAGGVKEMILISKEPINTLTQLKGKKFRHWDKVAMDGMRKLGLSVQTIPSPDLYLAMKTGVVDASMYGRTYVLSQSLDEVTKFYSVVGPFVVAAPTSLVVRKDIWTALPDDLKKILQTEAAKLYEGERQAFIEGKEEKDLAARMKAKGMTEVAPFSTEDRRTIQKAVLEAWRENSEKAGAEAIKNHDRIVEALK